jgi:hypothetical protein
VHFFTQVFSIQQSLYFSTQPNTLFSPKQHTTHLFVAYFFFFQAPSLDYKSHNGRDLLISLSPSTSHRVRHLIGTGCILEGRKGRREEEGRGRPGGTLSTCRN